MSDRLMAEALRTRNRGALATLYDSYAEDVYRYCHFLVQNAETAQVVLRDTFLVAQAQIHRLADPDRLRPWMYALARRECIRRGIPEAGAPPAEPGRDPDADLRVMAWNAVAGLTAAQREALELGTRHGMSMPDVAAVLALPLRDTEELVTVARDVLQGAVTAEVLARKGPYDCTERARILSGFSGRLGAELRDRVIHHVTECPRCSAHQARQVSAVKVYGMLPVPELPKALRARVMSCFTDPELVPYRRWVARRAGNLDAEGFPGAAGRVPRTWPRAVAGALTSAAALVIIVAGLRLLGPGADEPWPAAAGPSNPVRPPGIVLPWRTPSPEPLPNLVPVHRWWPSQPLGSRASTEPLIMSWTDLPGEQHLIGPPAPGQPDDWEHPGDGHQQPPHNPPGQSPSDPGTTPGEPDPTPSRPDPTPSDPSPSDPAPTPSDPDPGPSDPSPTRSDPPPTPSDPAPTPSDPAPTPSKEPSRSGTPSGSGEPRKKRGRTAKPTRKPTFTEKPAKRPTKTPGKSPTRSESSGSPAAPSK